MARRLMSRFGVAVSVAAVVLSLSAGAAFAGEITGNGKSLKLEDGGKWGTGLHARSECAYSGQEDDQFLDNRGNPLPEDEVVKGDPAHAQSWGQIPKYGTPGGPPDGRDELTALGFNPGHACNPTGGHD